MSAVVVANMALSFVGSSATLNALDPTDTRAEAQVVRQFIPIVWKEILEKHDWSFASKTVQLAYSTVSGWTYGYIVPSDLIALRQVVRPDRVEMLQAGKHETEHFYIHEGKIYTSAEDAYFRYTAEIDMINGLPASVLTATAYLLAARIAGNIVRGASARSAVPNLMLAYTQHLGEAKTYDSNATYSTVQPEHRPAWIVGR